MGSSDEEEESDDSSKKRGKNDSGSSKSAKSGRSKRSKSGKSGRGGGGVLEDAKCNQGTIIVANRADGTLTILDANDGEELEVVELPYNEDFQDRPDPVDVVSVNGLYYVGDRANNRVLVFDGVSNELVQIVPAGAGIWEMAVDNRGTQLWVNNQLDNTSTIIDLSSFVPIRTIEAPAGVGNGVVHDVVLSPSGDEGFVTYVGDGGAVVKWSSGAGTQLAINTANVGDNLRATLSFRFNCLYVPSTDSNTVHVLFTGDLFQEQTIAIADPFDAVPTRDGSYVYITSTTNDAIYTLDIANNVLLDTVVTTPVVNPTKLTVSANRLFVAHSDADMVTVYSFSSSSPIPILIDAIDVGDNPYGIAHCAPLRPIDCNYY